MSLYICPNPECQLWAWVMMVSQYSSLVVTNAPLLLGDKDSGGRQYVLMGRDKWKLFLLSTQFCWGFPCGSAGKEPACNVGGLAGFDPWTVYRPQGHKESDTTEQLLLSVLL